MDKVVILYTMEGCPYCLMIKDKLNELSIPYIDRNINEHKDEYDVFVEITESDFVPAFMVIENINTKPESFLYVPERDFNEIDEGVEIIREYFKK
jgi:glutaredoxin